MAQMCCLASYGQRPHLLWVVWEQSSVTRSKNQQPSAVTGVLALAKVVQMFMK